jgi:tryptophan synthase alpha chain
MPELEIALRKRVDGGGKCFVPYVTGGVAGVGADLLRGLQSAGADAIEVGIPFSDPVIDGEVIQEASRSALERGVHPSDVLATIGEAALEIPVAVMTYLNPVFRHGFDEFLRESSAVGVSGIIVPDLPIDEAGEWIEQCAREDVAPVLLVAPGEREDRRRRTAVAGRGFVYCVASYGVTGTRSSLEGTAEEVVASMRELTDVPLLVGVGIATPEQASAACGFADGVIVGSAIVKRLADRGPDGALSLAAEFRRAIPQE